MTMATSQVLRNSHFISIAAVNGACAGAGLSWACACDLRVASETALFRSGFLTAGLSGDFGGRKKNVLELKHTLTVLLFLPPQLRPRLLPSRHHLGPLASVASCLIHADHLCTILNAGVHPQRYLDVAADRRRWYDINHYPTGISLTRGILIGVAAALPLQGLCVPPSSDPSTSVR